MREVLIDSIRVSLQNYQRILILQVKDEDTYVPIPIGPAEADAIAVKLQDVQLSRPLTHDLLRSVIEITGCDMSRIVVSDLKDDTFYAKLMVNYHENIEEVDCRSSDAIALAVRMGVPMFVADHVVEKAGIRLDTMRQDTLASEEKDSS